MSEKLTVTVVEQRVDVTTQLQAVELSVSTTTVVVDGAASIELTQPAALEVRITETPTTLTITPQTSTTLVVSDVGAAPIPHRIFFTTQAGATQSTLTAHAGADTSANFMQLNNPDTAQDVFEVFIWSP